MARNNVVIPDCEECESGNCNGNKYQPCPKEQQKLCCCVCSEHLACFLSIKFGCAKADRSAKSIFADMADDMWVNQNGESHCPIDGHL